MLENLVEAQYTVHDLIRGRWSQCRVAADKRAVEAAHC